MDYLQIDPHRLGVVLGDVAGKGLPAALLMAKLQATVRALASECASLGDFGRRVNRIVHRDGLPNRFATLVYLEIAPGSGRVRLVNAGHMPPLLLKSGSIRGRWREGRWRSESWPRPISSSNRSICGPMLVVYIDGVTDAMNRAGEFFGDERLRATLAGATTSTAEAAGRRVLAAADAFTGDARVFDDLSLVLLKRLA